MPNIWRLIGVLLDGGAKIAEMRLENAKHERPSSCSNEEHRAGTEEQPAIQPVTPLQVAKQVTRLGRLGRYGASVRDLQFLLPCINADLEALERLIPKEAITWEQWIKFLKCMYPSVQELVADGLAASNVACVLKAVHRHSSDPSGTGTAALEEYDRLTGRVGVVHGDMLEQARLTGEAAIAQGLSIFDEAETYYWIAFTLHSRRYQAFFSEPYTRTKPEKDAEAPLKLAVKLLHKWLRQDHQDLEALKLLASCYCILGNKDALYKAEIELKKAESARQSTGNLEAARGDRFGLSFELKCQRLLEAKGFATILTSVTSDGGIDIVARSMDPILSGTYIVQCKDWQDGVGVKPVRELYGVVVSEDANKGILIASSYFTSSAIQFAHGKRLELIDGEQLDKLIQQSSTSMQ